MLSPVDAGFQNYQSNRGVKKSSWLPAQSKFQNYPQYSGPPSRGPSLLSDPIPRSDQFSNNSEPSYFSIRNEPVGGGYLVAQSGSRTWNNQLQNSSGRFKNAENQFPANNYRNRMNEHNLTNSNKSQTIGRSFNYQEGDEMNSEAQRFNSMNSNFPSPGTSFRRPTVQPGVETGRSLLSHQNLPYNTGGMNYPSQFNEEEVIVKEKPFQFRNLKIISGTWRFMIEEIGRRSNCQLKPSFDEVGKEHKLIMIGTKESIAAAENWVKIVLNKHPPNDYKDIVNAVKELKKVKYSELYVRKNDEKVEIRRIASLMKCAMPMDQVQQSHKGDIQEELLKYPLAFPRSRKQGITILNDIFRRKTDSVLSEEISTLRQYFFEVDCGIRLRDETEYKRNVQTLAIIVYIHGKEGRGYYFNKRLKFLLNQLRESKEETIPKNLRFKINECYKKLFNSRGKRVESLRHMAVKFQENL